ncbi:MAG: 3-oxoacyl-ACP reductase FabG [Sphingomonadales bacterium]
MPKRVLVTGASRGIGKAIAEDLAKSGFDLVVHCRSNVEMAETVCESARELGRDARCLVFDVGDRAAAREMINADISKNGAYYGVICNAGIHRDNAFPAMTDDDWDSVIETNLHGFYNVVHPCIMPMVQARSGGRIVVMSSVSGIMGNRGQVNYSAAKAGLIGAAKSLAIELAKRKITVNVVAPGIIESDMTEELDPAIIRQMVPLRRAGQAEEVASLVSYLCSDAAAYITRQVISVNGGMF